MPVFRDEESSRVRLWIAPSEMRNEAGLVMPFGEGKFVANTSHNKWAEQFRARPPLGPQAVDILGRYCHSDLDCESLARKESVAERANLGRIGPLPLANIILFFNAKAEADDGSHLGADRDIYGGGLADIFQHKLDSDMSAPVVDDEGTDGRHALDGNPRAVRGLKLSICKVHSFSGSSERLGAGFAGV